MLCYLQMQDYGHIHFYLRQFGQGCFENAKDRHFSHINKFGTQVCNVERLVVHGQRQMYCCKEKLKPAMMLKCDPSTERLKGQEKKII